LGIHSIAVLKLCH